MPPVTAPPAPGPAESVPVAQPEVIPATENPPGIDSATATEPAKASQVVEVEAEPISETNNAVAQEVSPMGETTTTTAPAPDAIVTDKVPVAEIVEQSTIANPPVSAMDDDATTKPSEVASEPAKGQERKDEEMKEPEGEAPAAEVANNVAPGPVTAAVDTTTTADEDKVKPEGDQTASGTTTAINGATATTTTAHGIKPLPATVEDDKSEDDGSAAPKTNEVAMPDAPELEIAPPVTAPAPEPVEAVLAPAESSTSVTTSNSSKKRKARDDDDDNGDDEDITNGHVLAKKARIQSPNGHENGTTSSNGASTTTNGSAAAARPMKKAVGRPRKATSSSSSAMQSSSSSSSKNKTKPPRRPPVSAHPVGRTLRKTRSQGPVEI